MVAEGVVEAVTTTRVTVPIAGGIVLSTGPLDAVTAVLVEVRTDEGVVGQGFAYTLDATRGAALELIVQSLVPALLGAPVDAPAERWADMIAAPNALGATGATMVAVAAIDTAVWDAAARTADEPLHRLLGSVRSEISTYASSGLWLSTPIAELAAEAQRHVDAEFTAVKLRLGHDPATDLARVAAVREAVGPAVAIHVDANQQFGVADAIARAGRLADLGVVWFEDPVPARDLDALAEVRAASSVDVVAGETAFGPAEARAMLGADAVDIVMPDLQRIGGITGFLQTADAAAAAGRPMSTHFFTEYSVSLAGSVAGMTSIEHIDWFVDLFEERVEIVDGRIQIPNRPGIGFRFDADFVEAHGQP